MFGFEEDSVQDGKHTRCSGDGSTTVTFGGGSYILSNRPEGGRR